MVLMRKDVLYECEKTYVMKRKEDPYALHSLRHLYERVNLTFHAVNALLQINDYCTCKLPFVFFLIFFSFLFL